MNVIIPLGGKGERFTKNGYKEPKPLIKIFDKCMIEYVYDNLFLHNDDKIFIIYNYKLDDHNFSDIILAKYPNINLIKIGDTKGAVETLFLGIGSIFNNHQYHEKSIILDCDTFYTEDILSIFRNSDDSMVFYTKKYSEKPVYSYIELDDNSNIINVKEKVKISDNANTGAYAFNDINNLYKYCKYVLDNNITFKGEPYTSCVISEMINDNIKFKGYELIDKYVFSLGTPEAVNRYIDNTYGFLFDLDGTLVITDDIYFNVWHEILSNYNIELTHDLFRNYIQGNSDKYVCNSLLYNVVINHDELSNLKDDLFIENIDRIKVIDGVYDIIKNIKLTGNKICIVTNCNRRVADEIIKYIHLNNEIDFIISSNDCKNSKPHPEPYLMAIDRYNMSNNKCFIFEDSKSGLLSGNSVNPKVLLGIETIYDAVQLSNYGADYTLKNYVNLNVSDLMDLKQENEKYLSRMIEDSVKYKYDIKDIIIDDKKLKGGFIADVVRFKIITDDDDIHSLILKYENKQTNNLSSMAKQLQLYQREYYFYKYISGEVNVKIPAFISLIKNKNFEDCGMILENLIDKGYKINLNLNMENIEVSLKIVNRMARMHSKFWNKNLKQIFPELKKSNDIIFHPFFTYFIEERRESFKMRWTRILNEYQLRKCDEIFDEFTNIQTRFSVGSNLTFIHGDIKSPNIFYDVENDYEPYFIDWQHCAIGKGVQDLIFFIIESYDITNINLVFDLMKNYYYKKLLEYGVKNYSMIEYEKDIYDAICYIPFFTSVWFGTIPQDELIDKNFPFFLIKKMFHLLEIIG